MEQGNKCSPMNPGKKNCPSLILSVTTSSASQPSLEYTAAAAVSRSSQSRSTATILPSLSTKTAVLWRYSSSSSFLLWMKVP